jgi:phosphatidylglycerophosphate synthase
VSYRVITLPNLLSGLRLILSLVLLYIAWLGNRGLFLILFFAALITDALDGLIARKFNQATPFGARIDSYGDIALYAVFPVCLWLLWPEIVKRELIYLMIVCVSYSVSLIISLIKFGRLPAYHTRAAKISAILFGITVFLLLLYDIALPFRIASVLQILVALEIVLITLRLPQWHDNVPSLWRLPATEESSNAAANKPQPSP